MYLKCRAGAFSCADDRKERLGEGLDERQR